MPGLLDNQITRQAREEEKNKFMIQNGHGIVVLSLIKAGKYTVLNLCLFVRFSNAFLLQIKVCVIHLVGLVHAYNSLTNTF